MIALSPPNRLFLVWIILKGAKAEKDFLENDKKDQESKNGKREKIIKPCTSTSVLAYYV